MKDEIDEVENVVAEKRELIREGQGNLMGGTRGGGRLAWEDSQLELRSSYKSGEALQRLCCEVP